MWHVGLDVHARQTTLCVLDGRGNKIRTDTVRGPWANAVEELSRIRRPFDVCYEASLGYGALYDQLRKVAHRVLVAHPGRVRLIFCAKRKNDRIDALKLAKLLYLGEVPTVHVPRSRVRASRTMIRHRHRLVAERTRAKNAIRAILRRHGIQAPRGLSLWRRANMKWLVELSFEEDLHAVQRDMHLERIAHLNSLIRRVEKILEQEASYHPGVRLLMTIPGVGIRTAEAVMAHLDHPERFVKNKSIGSYFGVVPSQDSSGGINRLGHITRQGPAVVRHMLVEAVWQGIRRSPQIRSHYERIRRGDPKRRKIAVVATAHYLLRVMLSMLQGGQEWSG